MSNEEDMPLISDPVDLSREVYTDGSDYQLLCCSGGGGSTDPWLTAGELVYHLTRNAGKVVSDVITFELEQENRVEIKLLGGHFEVKRGDEVVHTGRKALELLMRLKGLTFEEALEWIAGKFSTEKAAVLAEDYVKMRLAAFEKGR